CWQSCSVRATSQGSSLPFHLPVLFFSSGPMVSFFHCVSSSEINSLAFFWNESMLSSNSIPKKSQIWVIVSSGWANNSSYVTVTYLFPVNLCPCHSPIFSCT